MQQIRQKTKYNILFHYSAALSEIAQYFLRKQLHFGHGQAAIVDSNQDGTAAEAC